jgi:hypothetical protein
MKLPNGVALFEQTVILAQDNDTNDDVTLGQELKLSTLSAGVGADDKYLIIETERWAIDYDEIDTLAAYMKNLLKPIDSDKQ